MYTVVVTHVIRQSNVCEYERSLCVFYIASRKIANGGIIEIAKEKREEGFKRKIYFFP